MGQFDFTYELPTNFSSIVIQLLRQKQHNDMAHAFQQCKFEYDDKGLAYYAGMRGDNWDKRALDFTFEGSEKNIELLTKENAILKELIGRALKPSSSGFLVRNVDFLQVENSFDVELPKEQGENFEVLSTDIHDALSKDEPSLVLDRLHTYSSKYLREICAKHAKERSLNYSNRRIHLMRLFVAMICLRWVQCEQQKHWKLTFPMNLASFASIIRQSQK